MLTLPRYAGRDAVGASLVALGIMLSLVWLVQSLHFLDLLINKGLGIGIFLHLTLLLVPLLLTVIAPLSIFTGATVMLRRWQEDNEITAVLAGGRAPSSLLWPLLAWALAGVVFGYALYLYILPASTSAFKDLQERIREQSGQLLLEEGTFNQLNSNMMIYIRKRLTPTTIDQILVHDTRNPAQPVTWYARSGEVVTNPDGYPRLILKDGLRQEVGPKQVSMLEFKKYNLDVSRQVDTQTHGPRAPEKEEYSMGELWRRAHDASLTAKQRAEMLAEWNKRLLWPLSPVPLVLLAAAWLLHPPKRQQSSTRCVVGASLCCIGYLAGMMGLFSMAQDGNMLAMYVQWGLPVFGLWTARWVARWGRWYG